MNELIGGSSYNKVGKYSQFFPNDNLCAFSQSSVGESAEHDCRAPYACVRSLSPIKNNMKTVCISY